MRGNPLLKCWVFVMLGSHTRFPLFPVETVGGEKGHRSWNTLVFLLLLPSSQAQNNMGLQKPPAMVVAGGKEHLSWSTGS